MKINSFFFTWSSISFVWPAERQKRTRDSVNKVAGKPTVTTAQPRFNISRLTALEKNKTNQIFLFQLFPYAILAGMNIITGTTGELSLPYTIKPISTSCRRK